MSIIQGTSKSSAATYEIDQSIRFNDGDSPYLNRTFGTPTSNSQFGYSFWIKLGEGYDGKYIISANGGGNNDNFTFDSGQIRIQEGGVLRLKSDQVFRDFGSWYHFLVAYDLGNATASQKLRVYLNGSEITSWATDTRSSFSSTSSRLNAAVSHDVGANVFNGVSSHVNNWDGYIAEFHFVDGAVLSPTDFGETNSTTGQWVPVEYTGSYGTNGFYLKGQDSSALGDDSSGNGNDFTSSGLAANDQVTDTPTNNFATWNPLIPLTSGNFTDGNLEFTVPGSTTSQHAKSTISFTSGEKKVCEMQTVSGSSITLGICDEDFVADNNGFTGDSRGYFDTNGNKVDSAGNSSSYGASFGTSNVIRIEVDLSSNPGTIEFFKDGVSQGDAFTDIDSTKTWFFWCRCKVDAVKANFGQLGFAGTPTTGFTALNTSNIPDPTTVNPANYFDTKLWAGNSTDGRAITGYGFQPDWVWIKARNNAYSHSITDAVRGAGPYIQSNTSDAEASGPGAFGSTLAFTSDGFTLDNGTISNLYVNQTGTNYVGWAWKANGAGSSNTDGSITSTVSANTTSGFSIVSYTGTGANATVGHGLGVAPSMVICKQRNASRSWVVYHEGLTSAANVIYLDLTSAQVTDSTVWNSTDPTSTVFSVGSANGSNSSGNGMIAYCFAEVEGFSKFGSYTGDGSTDGPFIHLGFKPSWVMFKRTNSTADWMIKESSGRDPFNVMTNRILANTSFTDDPHSSNNLIDFVSNGMKHRMGSGTGNNAMNTSGSTYIYMAFAKSPFKTATAR